MSAPAVRQRPIFGGVFGLGRYSLATIPCMSHGLHAVRYMVIEPQAGAVLSVADDKRDALAAARKLLRAAGSLAQRMSEPECGKQAALWPDDAMPPLELAGAPTKPISRRRREVFERSQGRCHYCDKPLTLDGKWHIEHMRPKALDGDDDPVNLVVACVGCNLAKADTTALEFIARLTAGTNRPSVPPAGKPTSGGKHEY